MPTWVKFKLIKLPYYDQEGRILESIVGRQNRPGIDEFSGGGKVYPDLSSFPVLSHHETDDNLMVQFDAEPNKILKCFAATATLSYMAGPKDRRYYQPKDFCATLMRESEAITTELAIAKEKCPTEREV